MTQVPVLAQYERAEDRYAIADAIAKGLETAIIRLKDQIEQADAPSKRRLQRRLQRFQECYRTAMDEFVTAHGEKSRLMKRAERIAAAG